MSRRTNAYSLVATLCVAQFLVAFAVASGSCEFAIAAYVATGLIALGTVMAVPFFARRTFKRHQRLSMALGFALLGLTTWLIGWLITMSRANCGI